MKEYLLYINCKSNSINHLIRLNSIDNNPFIQLTLYLNPYQSFWDRLKVACKFIFSKRIGFTSSFSEATIRKDRLKSIVEEL